jgi:hypothetical protein
VVIFKLLVGVDWPSWVLYVLRVRKLTVQCVVPLWLSRNVTPGGNGQNGVMRHQTGILRAWRAVLLTGL